jgi:hypothetical protein
MPAPTNAPEPSPRRSRVEDEVLEILMKADRPPTSGEKARVRIDEARIKAHRSLAARPGLQARAQNLARSPFGLIVGSLVLAIVAAMMRSAFAPLAVLLGLGSAAMLLALWFDRRPRPETGQRWRGRDLDDGPRMPDIERFRQRWKTGPDH